MNIFHDSLPYHNHDNFHIDHAEHHKSFELEDEQNHEHCENYDHTLCNICVIGKLNSYNQMQLKISFSVLPTDIIIQNKDIDISTSNNIYAFENDKSHILKSKHKKRPNSLRAPPFIV